MDAGKKKTGIAILCGALMLTMGTSIAFAASIEKQINSNVSTNAPSTQSIIQKAVGNRQEGISELTQALADIYAVYSEYGLTFGPNTNNINYNDELVRRLFDLQTDTAVSRSFEAKGVVDIKLPFVTTNMSLLAFISIVNKSLTKEQKLWLLLIIQQQYQRKKENV